MFFLQNQPKSKNQILVEKNRYETPRIVYIYLLIIPSCIPSLDLDLDPNKCT